MVAGLVLTVDAEVNQTIGIVSEDGNPLRATATESQPLPPAVGLISGQVLVWDGTAWVANPQNSGFVLLLGRIIAPGTGALLLGSASAIEGSVDPGPGNHISFSTPEGRLQDTVGNTFFSWLEGTGLSFNGAAPTAKPNITGSRGGNAALASLLSALDTLGLVIDSTTA